MLIKNAYILCNLYSCAIVYNRKFDNTIVFFIKSYKCIQYPYKASPLPWLPPSDIMNMECSMLPHEELILSMLRETLNRVFKVTPFWGVSPGVTLNSKYLRMHW